MSVGVVEAVLMLPMMAVDAVFLIEVTAGLHWKRLKSHSAVSGRVAVLVPAHNEQAIIGRCLAAMRDQAPPGTRIRVIAHNCHDATEAEALSAEAEVARLDRPGERGKGYALDFGRELLAQSPPDVVVVLDADCEPEGDAIARLAAGALRHDCAVQAAYLFRPTPADAPVVQISNFAVMLKNLVRQRGCARLGAPPMLVGSGMAFPWSLFATLPLATADLVEDLVLTVDLVRSGRTIRFEESARIWSTPGTVDGTRTQRARWDAGYLQTARSLGLALLADGIRGRWSAMWTGLHILTPPLTALLAMNAVLVLMLALATPLGGSVTMLTAGAALTAGVFIAVLLAWLVEGRGVMPARSIGRLPGYFAWKLMLYVALLRRRERASWIRTERAG